ncbi:methylosome subunit pICln-like [Physella acuta]|uniref:methylosome subunit pICln-like n=1 Tax=Physella acuta TaxID=109671 RepID=UPI0027DACF4C|nr:methylosome subunit pICln-like [Physella acuta]
MVLLINHSVPSEGIHHTESNVTANIEGSDIGSGSLYITESSVLWLNDNDQGIQLEYKLICLHAISRDLTNFPHEHLLCHYEGKVPGLKDENESDEDENERDNDSVNELTEIRFIPQNKESLQAMFEALANCQTLHPDSDCQLSGDDFEDAEEGSGDAIYDTEESEILLTDQGRIQLERLNQLLGAGQGDADLSTRTSEMRITNGHEPPTDSDQFQDADNMDS